jgi:large conductance mechanosensitive channel
MKNFIEFIRGRGIIGFAIGFILGKAVSDLIGSLVSDIISPAIGLATGNLKNLEAMSFQIGDASIKYGNFILLAINFLILALVVYILFKVLGLEKLDKKDEVKH